jgi:uncharacterized protein (DUF4415 family)
MKPKHTSTSSVISKTKMAKAIAVAPSRVSGSDAPYDPNDAAAVEKFWSQGKVRLPGQRGAQKAPTKIAVTVRYSPEVIDFFKATGEGWQTRMNDALRKHVARQ